MYRDIQGFPVLGSISLGLPSRYWGSQVLEGLTSLLLFSDECMFCSESIVRNPEREQTAEDLLASAVQAAPQQHQRIKLAERVMALAAEARMVGTQSTIVTFREVRELILLLQRPQKTPRF